MAKNASRRTSAFDYDVTLSFAGEDRAYVQTVAEGLSERGVRVFYDAYEEDNLWGKDLFQHLDYIYNKSARFCVIFISNHYAKKLWTSHEIKSAQARAFVDRSEYILPARFDDTEIPGIRSTVGYIDLRLKTAQECVKLIVQKLAPYKLLEFHERERYFPPNPDILYKLIGIKGKRERLACNVVARGFFDALSRTTTAERKLLCLTFIHSCSHDFPWNIHIELDLLRRLAKLPIGKIKTLLSGLTSIGFSVKFCDQDENETENPDYVYITWILRVSGIGIPDNLRSGFDMGIAIATVRAISRNYCREHAISALMKLNFSALSKATAVDDAH